MPACRTLSSLSQDEMNVCGRMDDDMNVVEDVEGMRLDLHRLHVDMRGIELMVQRVSKLITQLLDTLYRYQAKLEPGPASRHDDDSAEDEIGSLGFSPIKGPTSTF